MGKINFSFAIFLCTYEDDIFIEKQIDSILTQTYTNFKLFISDDSKSKKIIEIVHEYQKKNDNIFFRVGPKKNFSANFLSLVYDKNINSDIFLFCDQDDYWLPRKLEHIANVFKKKQFIRRSVIYSSSKTLINEIGYKIKDDIHNSSFINFENAVVKNIMGGNTIAFNNSFRNLIITFELKGENIFLHDWWCYLIATIFNSKIILDKKILILYRQHENTIIGGSYSRFITIKNIFTNKINLIQAMKDHAHILSVNQAIWENLKISNKINDYINFCSANRLHKIFLFFKNRYSRGSFFQNLYLILLILFFD